MSHTSHWRNPEQLPAMTAGDIIQVVIESTRGSRNKFKFDAQSGVFKLSKVLPAGMAFPYDFGFVPSTKAEDGDPIDALVLMDEPGFPGCVVPCRLIGVIEAEQEQDGKKYRNDRLIAVAQASILYDQVKHLSDLSASLRDQIGAFFVNYQKLRGVQVQIVGQKDARQALKLLQLAMPKAD